MLVLYLNMYVFNQRSYFYIIMLSSPIQKISAFSYSFSFPITTDINSVLSFPLNFSKLNLQNISRSFHDLDNLIEISVISRLCYF